MYLHIPGFQTTCVSSSNFPSLTLYSSKKLRKHEVFSSLPGSRENSAIWGFTLELIILISPICSTDFDSKSQNKDLCNSPFSTYPAAHIDIPLV